MPASTYPDLLVRLKEHLSQKVFPERQADVWIPDGNLHPLLILKLPVEVAGFAVSNGDPKQSFEECYSDFKKIYADNHDAWDSLNVSFVLCLERRKPELESLFSSIETDTYFCRKFVVSFEESIDDGLEILPFVPLERSEGTFRRPPSARTLLQRQLGVPAKLAEYLIELGARSDDHIVSDCLKGDFGEPRLEINSKPLSGRDSITSQSPVRLKELQIRNFRAYRKLQSFDLDADLIVLYGPNGFGKTSFFDAIDFGVTGEIGHLNRLKDDNNRFRKAAVNLEAGTESSLVTLVFQNGSVPQKLTRSVENRRKPNINARAVSNKKAIANITGIQKATGGEHIRNLIKLFRATHLFSQENQELVSDFHLTSEL
jgi:exonuclease SbcC